MKNFMKGKVATTIIVLATFVLAGVAIFTAIRLYQLRQQPVAPNVPSSIPKAAEVTSCTLSFTLNVEETATPSGTPTATPSGTPVASPPESAGPSATPNTCGGTCGSNSNCQSSYVCYQGFCRNPSCTGDTDCVCNGTPGPTASGSATPAVPTLPQSGTDWPTLVGAGVGIFTILGALLLAL